MNKKTIELKGFFDILKKSLPISLNFIIDLIPFTLCIIFFKYLNKPVFQEILALSVNYLNVSFGYLMGIQDVIGIRCSKEFGRKNSKMFWQKFFSFLIINFFLLIVAFFMVFFSGGILVFLKVKKNIVDLLQPFLIKLIIAKIFENLNHVLKGVLIAQKISAFFFITNIVNLLVFSSLS